MIAFALTYIPTPSAPTWSVLALVIGSVALAIVGLVIYTRRRRTYADEDVHYTITLLSEDGDATVERSCTTRMLSGEHIRRHNAYADHEMSESDLKLRAWDSSGAELPVTVLARKSARFQFDIDLGNARGSKPLRYSYSYLWKGLFADGEYWFEMNDAARRVSFTLVVPQGVSIFDQRAQEVFRDGSRHVLRIVQDDRGVREGKVFMTCRFKKSRRDTLARLDWQTLWL